MSEIKTHERRYYLNVGSVNSPVWAPIGKGFLKFEEEKNVTCRIRRLFHEADEIGRVEGYSSAFRYEFELYSGAPAVSLIKDIADFELVGDEAVLQLMTVDTFSEMDTPEVFDARVRDYCVVPEKVYGEDNITYSGRLVASGEPVVGVCVMSTMTFVAG